VDSQWDYTEEEVFADYFDGYWFCLPDGDDIYFEE
jgi:hypothetical protein